MSDIDFSNLCRICLARTVEMVPLASFFNQGVDTESKTNEIIIDVIADVLHFSPNLSDRYPQFICPMCLDILKTAYNFKTLFEESLLILQQCLGETEEQKDQTKTEHLNESKASVELITGSNSYDINDIVIVEDEHGSTEESFQGFLKNLGNTITATFVDNHSIKVKQNSLPQLEFHNISSSSSSSSSESEGSPNTTFKSRNRSNSLDEYILIEGEKLRNNIELEYTKYSESDIKSLENIDKDLLESAMNLKYECANCKKIFAREMRYKKHIEVCGLEYKIANDNKGEKILISRLQCQYCMKIFKQQKYLNHHINISHKVSFYTCEICKVKLKTKRAYSYHKLTKHSEEKHICQYCGKKFAVAASLKLHIEIHTNRDTPQCICPVCGKTFHYKGGLFYHMKQHTNERKYQCEYCDKNFYTLFAKQRHVRTHTGIRPYACRFCEKRFFSLGERKRHEYIHTGTLPYRCQYCDKGFTSKYNLKVHWLNHSGDFTCETCNRRFIDNEVLQFHCKVKHKDLAAKEDSS